MGIVVGYAGFVKKETKIYFRLKIKSEGTLNLQKLLNVAIILFLKITLRCLRTLWTKNFKTVFETL